MSFKTFARFGFVFCFVSASAAILSAETAYPKSQIERMDRPPKKSASTRPLAETVNLLKQEIDIVKQRKAKAEIKSRLALALKLYWVDVGAYPTVPQGLKALVTAPKGLESSWHGPYVEQVPQDPWGRDYRYWSPGEHGDYDLFSLGADGKARTEDDITSWSTV